MKPSGSWRKEKGYVSVPLLGRREAFFFHYHTTMDRGGLEGAFGSFAVIVVFWWFFFKAF